MKTGVRFVYFDWSVHCSAYGNHQSFLLSSEHSTIWPQIKKEKSDFYFSVFFCCITISCGWLTIEQIFGRPILLFWYANKNVFVRILFIVTNSMSFLYFFFVFIIFFVHFEWSIRWIEKTFSSFLDFFSSFSEWQKWQLALREKEKEKDMKQKAIETTTNRNKSAHNLAIVKHINIITCF